MNIKLTNMNIYFPKERHLMITLFLSGIKEKPNPTEPRKQLKLF